MVVQIFLSPQVKWSVDISNKLVYTSYLTRKYHENLKTSWSYSPPPEKKILSALAKISWKIVIEPFP